MLITLETDSTTRKALLSVADVEARFAGPLADMVSAAQITGAVDVIIDLRKVARVDLRICAALARTARALASRRGSLRLVCSDGCDRWPLQVVGLESDGVVVDSLEQAGWPGRRRRAEDAQPRLVRQRRGTRERVPA